VRARFLIAPAIFLSALLVLPRAAAQSPAAQQAPPAQTPEAAAPAAQVPEPQRAPARPPLGTLILDAAHGGTDSGARGESGVVEKDVVAFLAQSLRLEIERRGARVILTRSGDGAPSFDDRAAVANAYPGAVFLSLHVSSSGPAATAIAYSLAQGAGPDTANARGDQPASPASFLIPWEDAQLRFVNDSKRFAELLQIQLAQKFKGSPEVPARAAVRQLLLVARPAVALEISSVAVNQRKQLDAGLPPDAGR
jgi:N-acetylmuramoyl-L-alanine amidase